MTSAVSESLPWLGSIVLKVEHVLRIDADHKYAISKQIHSEGFSIEQKLRRGTKGTFDLSFI